jgi:hypothetical protein
MSKEESGIFESTSVLYLSNKSIAQVRTSTLNNVPVNINMLDVKDTTCHKLINLSFECNGIKLQGNVINPELKCSR